MLPRRRSPPQRAPSRSRHRWWQEGAEQWVGALADGPTTPPSQGDEETGPAEESVVKGPNALPPPSDSDEDESCAGKPKLDKVRCWTASPLSCFPVVVCEQAGSE